MNELIIKAMTAFAYLANVYSIDCRYEASNIGRFMQKLLPLVILRMIIFTEA